MKAFRMILLSIILSIILGLFPSIALSVTYEVTVDENGFNPSALNILKGDTVRWVNKGSSAHSASNILAGLINSAFDSGLLNPGGTFEYTFTIPGVVYYQDETDTSHRGTVTAEGVTISPASSILVQSQRLDLVILEEVIQDGSKMRITLDGKVVYDSSELLTLPNTVTPDLGINGTWGPSARYIKIPISLHMYYPGTHTLTVEIYSPTGRLLTDSAVYELLGEEASIE